MKTFHLAVSIVALLASVSVAICGDDLLNPATIDIPGALATQSNEQELTLEVFGGLIENSFLANLGEAIKLAAPGEENLNQIAQSLRPMLTVELEFIRQTCDVQHEQRPRIKAAGEAALKHAARKRFRLDHLLAAGTELTERQLSQLDPRTVLHNRLYNSLKKILTPGQLSRYKEELEHRGQFRRRATILALVCRLDSELGLRRDQRESIIQSLSANWHDEWGWWLDQLEEDDPGIPCFIESSVVQHLNSIQRKAWDKIGKSDREEGVEALMLLQDANTIPVEDEAWWDG